MTPGQDDDPGAAPDGGTPPEDRYGVLCRFEYCPYPPGQCPVPE